MAKAETRRWLVEWFRKQSPALADAPEDEIVDHNYFEKGYIDSFTVVMLIEDVEQEFGFRFSEETFQDRRFSAISGLAEIIDEARS